MECIGIAFSVTVAAKFFYVLEVVEFLRICTKKSTTGLHEWSWFAGN